MRVAIVHDYLTQFGGAERVLLALTQLYPNATIHTLVYDRQGMRVPYFDQRRLQTSFLQNIPGARRHHRLFPLLMPLAIEQFDFSDYDIVLSDTHSFSKGIITGPRTMHISYCFTPTRYVWDDCHRYIREFSHLAMFRKLAPAGLSYIRLWDYYASQRVDYYLTLSHFVAQRIQKYYHRRALVIPPPVDISRFAISHQDQGYYLLVSRLVSYKRIDLAIAACEKLQRPLKIVGIGPEQKLLALKAGRYTEFLGFVNDQQLAGLYAGARAFLFPQEEDFGLTPLEAAATGKPTIAFASGGALETIIHGQTGIFFHQQTTASLIKAILEAEQTNFDPALIRAHAEGFGLNNFLPVLQKTVHNHWMAYQRQFTTRI